MPELRTELSAQRIDAQPNPALRRALSWLSNRPGSWEVAVDQGCGKLRHLELLSQAFRRVVLVDTERQLDSTHKLGDRRASIREYVTDIQAVLPARVDTVSASAFSRMTCNADVVFAVATFDVVPPTTRTEMIHSAERNLKPFGLYVVIAPRNDASILRRCSDENRYEDGHIFAHHGAYTFFRNFHNEEDISSAVTAHRFDLVENLSRYRQACMVFSRTGSNHE